MYIISYLSILLQVVVQNLRMGLLMWSQDVHKGGRGIACSGCGVDGSAAAQSGRQAERSGWCASVKSLLLKRLQKGRWNYYLFSLYNTVRERGLITHSYLCFCVNRPWNIWNACVAWCHRDSCQDRKDKWVKFMFTISECLNACWKKHYRWPIGFLSINDSRVWRGLKK